MTKYDRGFYNEHVDRSLESAVEVTPYILEVTQARSVIDVGCGLGTWLSAYAQLGIQDYLGIDGTWVDPAQLRIAHANFETVDLTQPVARGRRFDLAQSLEVAEHLPDTAAAGLVSYLVGLSDVVVFSAASPHQGGTHHINEQWPDYWQALFVAHGYLMYDIFRPKYWANANVAWWYAQNMFLYVKRERAAALPPSIARNEGWRYPQRVVHPHRIDPAYRPPRELAELLLSGPRILRGALEQSIVRPLRSLLAG